MISCARGCVTARRHATECADTDACRGCQPRLADFGALCISCHYRLARMLYEIPRATVLLEGHLAPGQTKPSSEYIKRTKGDPPAPLNVDILDCLRDIRDFPLAWARIHAEEHDLAFPVDAPTYLGIHLASIECADWICAAWDEFADLLSRAHALTPWRPQVQRLHDLCPECHCPSLVRIGGEDHATCQECRLVVTPERYALWSRSTTQEETAA